RLRFRCRAPPPLPGASPNCGTRVMLEAYSHEVSSCGYWPGGGPEGVFYSYAYPEPPGYAATAVQPQDASWSGDLGEFLLPYQAVRQAVDPQAALLTFLQSTYEAAANTAGWPRESLERPHSSAPATGHDRPSSAQYPRPVRTPDD